MRSNRLALTLQLHSREGIFSGERSKTWVWILRQFSESHHFDYDTVFLSLDVNNVPFGRLCCSSPTNSPHAFIRRRAEMTL